MIRSNIKVTFNCNKDKLWETITDNTNYSWRSDLSKIDVKNDKEFTEYDKNNYPTHFTITKKEKLKEYKFSFKNSNITGTWIGLFNVIGKDKIELDFTEIVDVKNFIMRLFTKTYLKKQQKRYINDLEKELNK